MPKNDPVIDLEPRNPFSWKIVAAFVNSDDLTAETLGTYMLGLSSQDPETMRAALQ